MAHLREMRVDGQLYWFNIGKTFIEIRSSIKKHLIRKDAIGFEADNGDLVVTPRMIRACILNNCDPDGIDQSSETIAEYFPQCCCSDSLNNKRLRVDPFDIEINNKKRYVLMCDDCYTERQFEI